MAESLDVKFSLEDTLKITLRRLSVNFFFPLSLQHCLIGAVEVYLKLLPADKSVTEKKVYTNNITNIKLLSR